MSDRIWSDMYSLQEQMLTFVEKFLHHFRLMSDQFWIHASSTLIWIGLGQTVFENVRFHVKPYVLFVFPRKTMQNHLEISSKTKF